jgi:hypothetical protein
MNAQNLVPNPSFEDTFACVIMTGQVANAVGWSIVSETPDYFHSCATFPISVPYNLFGYQNANSGDAYMGFWNYSSIGYTREMIGANLNSPMIVGTKYFVSYKIALAWNPQYNNNGASNNVGILLSTANYLTSTPSPLNFCHVNEQSILMDSINWVTVRGSIIADSNYSFITVGNFFSDFNTNVIALDSILNNLNVYYYVDDICISEDSSYCEIWTSYNSVSQDIIPVIYPNPGSEYITINSHNETITDLEIRNIIGQNMSFPKVNYNLPINISQFSSGIYFIRITTNKSKYKFIILTII